MEESPKEIVQLEHWGIPWSRRPDGRINQRPFGGHSFDRAVFAEDKTGFFEMHTLYDRLQKYTKVTRYDECYVTAIFTNQGAFCGVTAWDLASGEFFYIQGKALVIATGGACRMYGSLTLHLSGFALNPGKQMRNSHGNKRNMVHPEICRSLRSFHNVLRLHWRCI